MVDFCFVRGAGAFAELLNHNLIVTDRRKQYQQQPWLVYAKLPYTSNLLLTQLHKL